MPFVLSSKSCLLLVGSRLGAVLAQAPQLPLPGAAAAAEPVHVAAGSQQAALLLGSGGNNSAGEVLITFLRRGLFPKAIE